MRRHLWGCLATAWLALFLPNKTEAACPKLLMFDGVDIRSQTDPVNARYWGHDIGVQGFFLNNIMSAWQDDVGNDPSGSTWVRAKRFQSLYAAEGVTDNFIKVAVYKPHEWTDSAANSVIEQNFAHAAELAHAAGFKGIALDVEPYVAIWGGDAGGNELAPIIKAEGEAIGRVMKNAYPGMTLVVIGDPLYWASENQGYHGGYELALPFLEGLLRAGFAQVIAADERTYTEPNTEGTVRLVGNSYANFFRATNLRVNHFNVAAGLWPLGTSYHDKSARFSPDEFRRELRAAFDTGGDYTWIYGFGSAWQTGGPNGAEPVVGNFAAFVDEVHRARRGCER